jgi:Flp pilus assembly protein TadD
MAPWLRLGVLFAKQERFRDAVKAYQKALELDSKNGDAWNELGTIHLKAEAFDEAAEAFTKAIELDRGNGWAYSNLAYAYMQQGKHKEGFHYFLRSIELLRAALTKPCLESHSSLYRALNDYDNAVRLTRWPIN